MKYKITCLGCKQSAHLNILEGQVVYVDHTPIVASRLRADMKWGFECLCGNDDRLCASEISQVESLVQGATHVKDRLIKSAKSKKPRFNLEILQTNRIGG